MSAELKVSLTEPVCSRHEVLGASRKNYRYFFRRKTQDISAGCSQADLALAATATSSHSKVEFQRVNVLLATSHSELMSPNDKAHGQSLGHTLISELI